MSDAELLWHASCIRANRFRYSYGRQANRTLGTLKLPDAVPSFVHTIDTSPPAVERPEGPQLDLDPTVWTPVHLRDLFDFDKGKVALARDLGNGSVPFIGASAKNNGVTMRVDRAPDHPAGCLSVARDGSVGEAFYQPDPFVATVNVYVLLPLGWDMTPLRGHFLSTLIRREQYRYNYGRKWGLELMRNTKIWLPSDDEGAIDWAWVDRFMGHLRYAALS